MKYRVQVDLDFNLEVDAEAFVTYVKTLESKTYTPTVMDLAGDLYTPSRLQIIRDYDDEKNGRPGKTVRTEEITTVVKER